MTTKLLYLLTVLCIANYTYSQVPSTDIYLFDISDGKGTFELSNLTKVTDSDSYDNQPHFTPDGKSILFVSIADKQSDIFEYSIKTQQIKQLTDTEESEYSPTIIRKGKAFSTVRVESDKDSTQRIWAFPRRGGKPRLVMDKVKNIGYHAWLDKRNVAMFILGDTYTLQWAHTKKQKTRIISDSIGRSLYKIPGEKALSFVYKPSKEEVWIKRWDRKTGKVTPIIQALPESEDYAWHPDGYILMGSKGKLYRFDPKQDKTWQELVDIKSLCNKDFYRLAVSPNGKHLAIVIYRGERP